MVEIRSLQPDDARRCDVIVRSLPYHFALESGLAECARAVRNEPGFVAWDDEEAVGFLTFVERFHEAAEITWMAVRGDRRREGIGSQLIDRLAAELRARGRSMLCVLTVSPSDPSEEPPDGYQSTRAFYRKSGFVLLREFPGMWESDTPVLLGRPLR